MVEFRLNRSDNLKTNMGNKLLGICIHKLKIFIHALVRKLKVQYYFH